MTRRPDALENLLRLPSSPLSPCARDDESVRQFIRNAEAMLGDARLGGSSVHGSFTLAYEGVHCLAMALLNHFSVRAHSGEGHRTMALQVLVDQSGIAKLVPGAFQLVTRAHAKRNHNTYTRPLPPVSRAEADAMIGVLTAALAAVKRMTDVPLQPDDATESAGPQPPGRKR
jgi:hypothetical protein